MFDFCKLDVYQKAKTFCIMVSKLLASGKCDKTTKDQLRRASFSIMLNIAEGSSRFSNRDRNNFMVIARGSAFESAAIFDYLYEINTIDESTYNHNINSLEEISKMLFGLIQHLDKTERV
jgi:four helix bundle protein